MAKAEVAERLPTVDRLTQGLRGHINRYSHVVINVSDVERAVEFYEATFPVSRRVRINGPAQAYRGLGIEKGRFEGWVLENKRDRTPQGGLIAEFPARFIHLVEWKDPKPTGTPYREANHVGIYRQNSIVSNLDECYQRVIELGGRPYGEPSWIVLTPDGSGVTVFAFRDHDGVTLEAIGADPLPGWPDYPGASHHCNLNVSDLRRSYEWYRNTIGLDLTVYLAPSELQPATNGSLGDSLRNPDGSEFTDGQMLFAAALMGVRSDSRNPLDVLEWKTPKPYGTPYEVPNHLGIIRVAFEVDDVESAKRRLDLAGWPSGPVETWDMGEFGDRKVVIFKDPDGIMLELIEAIPMPTDPLPWD